MSQAFVVSGYEIIPALLTSDECSHLLAKLEDVDVRRAGSRNLLANDWCRQVAMTIKRDRALVPLLPAAAVAVQCTLFLKNAQRNWGVGFHQDLSLPVREKVADPALTGWSEKEGVVFVQPSVEALQNLVAVRVQLDPGSAESGPLRVLPGTHVLGRIAEARIEGLRGERSEVECVVPQGGALAMSPLLLHASSRMKGVSPRRVLHFLFGPAELPHGLNWHTAV